VSGPTGREGDQGLGGSVRRASQGRGADPHIARFTVGDPGSQQGGRLAKVTGLEGGRVCANSHGLKSKVLTSPFCLPRDNLGRRHPGLGTSTQWNV
jgi:hypothetical protein